MTFLKMKAVTSSRSLSITMEKKEEVCEKWERVARTDPWSMWSWQSSTTLKKKNCNWSCGSSGLSWISFFLTQVTLKHKNGLGSFLRRTPMIMHPNQALNLFDIPMYLSGYPSSTTEWLNKHGSMSSLWVCQILNVLRCSCPAFVLIF